VNEGQAIGARLREVRKRRGLTQRELARLSEVSLSFIRKLEQGNYSGGVRLETIHRLAVRPATVYRFATRSLRVINAFAAFRPLAGRPGAEH
jgi:transcriptional regulator with XRE-family HTH domain